MKSKDEKKSKSSDYEESNEEKNAQSNEKSGDSQESFSTPAKIGKSTNDKNLLREFVVPPHPDVPDSGGKGVAYLRKGHWNLDALFDSG